MKMASQEDQKAMGDLCDFVAECHLDYAAAGILDDPSYEWELAHHPIPKCEGGTETVTLLKKDHAAHGVLQSEAFQRPCIYGWESDYLDGELLELCKKWHTLKSKQSNALLHENKNEEGKSLHSLKSHREKTDDGKSLRMVKLHKKKDEDGKSLLARRMAQESHKERDENGKSINAIKHNERIHSVKTSDGKSVIGVNLAKRSHAQRWMCLETGHISSPAGLSSWQRARGIDYSRRVKISDE
jgi:hypothetical protein